MSAHVCNDLTIATTAIWAVGLDAPDEDVMACAVILQAENCRSVNYRYSYHEPEMLEPFELTAGMLTALRKLSLARALGAIECYAYQASECSDWATTPAAILVGIATRRCNEAGAIGRDGWGVRAEDVEPTPPKPKQPASQLTFLRLV